MGGGQNKNRKTEDIHACNFPHREEESVDLKMQSPKLNLYSDSKTVTKALKKSMVIIKRKDRKIYK